MNPNAERLVRRPECLVLHKPTQEQVDYAVACEPPTLNGAKRMLYTIEGKGMERGFNPANGVYSCDTIEEFKDVMLANPSWPIPAIKLRYDENDDNHDIERSMQYVWTERMRSINGLREEVLTHYNAHPVNVDITNGVYPLRVLLVTSRFTTVLKYMIRDVAAGFKALGHEVEILMEQSAWERNSMVSTLQRVKEFRPHIVFQVDGVRPGQFEKALRKTFHFCGWIQDDMPHLWDKAMVNDMKTNTMDWTLGMFPSITGRLSEFGYPNCFLFPVAANDEIFRPGLSDERYACDIAFPCNVGSQRTVSRDEFFQRRVLPVFWAREMGLDVRVWGSGWDKLSETQDIWQGHIENGPELAKVYRSAKMVLHANSDTNLHQRVFETMASHTVSLIWEHPSDNDHGGLMSLFEDEMFIRFRDKEDFQRKVRYYLNDPSSRAQIANTGYHAITQTHTYKHRIAGLLNTIGYRRGEVNTTTPKEHKGLC